MLLPLAAAPQINTVGRDRPWSRPSRRRNGFLATLTRSRPGTVRHLPNCSEIFLNLSFFSVRLCKHVKSFLHEMSSSRLVQSCSACMSLTTDVQRKILRIDDILVSDLYHCGTSSSQSSIFASDSASSWNLFDLHTGFTCDIAFGIASEASIDHYVGDLGLWVFNGFLNDFKLWVLNCLLHGTHAWSLHDRHNSGHRSSYQGSATVGSRLSSSRHAPWKSVSRQGCPRPCR